MTDYSNTIPWKDWKIVRRMGGGGFGSVYEIERNIYGEKECAAMKMIRIPEDESALENDYSSGMSEEEIREKYVYIRNYYSKEYQIMLEFKGHSNIVNCHDFSVIQNPSGPGYTLFIRMELLTPLKELVKKEIFSEDKVIRLGIDICRALEICESKNVIHRDIKPDNILISKFGDFKLGDFGIARMMEMTMSATRTGTLNYMAPEVAKKMKYGKSVDTYSLGLVIYWLLNDARLPFVTKSGRVTHKEIQAALSRRIRGDRIPAPARGSRQLKALVLKAVSFDREERYHSGKEMLDALLQLRGFSEEDKKKLENTKGHKITKESIRSKENSVPQNHVDCWDEYDGLTLGR